MDESLDYSNFTFDSIHKTRVIDKEGQPWFVAADVCRALWTLADHVKLRIEELRPLLADPPVCNTVQQGLTYSPS